MLVGLYTNSNGDLSIVTPTPDATEKMMQGLVYKVAEGTIILATSGFGRLTKNEAERKIIEMSVPNGVQFEIVNDYDVPADRTFRNAWRHDTSPAPEKVKTDIPAARVIAHDIRRADREGRRKPLDIQATIPAQASAAEAARQAIRDANAQVQAEIDAATDEATLKQVLVNAGML